MFILQSVVYKRGQHAIHSAKITKPPYPTGFDRMENVNNMGKVMNKKGRGFLPALIRLLAFGYWLLAIGLNNQ